MTTNIALGKVVAVRNVSEESVKCKYTERPEGDWKYLEKPMERQRTSKDLLNGNKSLVTY